MIWQFIIHLQLTLLDLLSSGIKFHVLPQSICRVCYTLRGYLYVSGVEPGKNRYQVT